MFDYIASEPLALKACDASAIPVPPIAKPKDGAEFILDVTFPGFPTRRRKASPTP